MEALFGSLPEMLAFQKVFLQTLGDTVELCPNFSSLDTPGELKVSVPDPAVASWPSGSDGTVPVPDLKDLLLSLGASFLFYADHFKHYGSFCANHVKVQKVLERGETWSRSTGCPGPEDVQ